MPQSIRTYPLIRRLSRQYLTLRQKPIPDYFDSQKQHLFRTVWPNTMVSYARLNNMYLLAKRIDRDRIPGAIVECGVWKGGCIAVAAAVSAHNKSRRHIWLFDSFEHLPMPTERDGQKALEYMRRVQTGELPPDYGCVSQVQDTEQLFFERLSIDPALVHICQGWFKETIPKHYRQIGPIALLRLDSDWYESEKLCLDYLFDLVSPGGFVIFDDYGYWPGSRAALEDYLAEYGLTVDLKRIDRSGRYLQKHPS